jgi:hypothetical protein
VSAPLPSKQAFVFTATVQVLRICEKEEANRRAGLLDSRRAGVSDHQTLQSLRLPFIR